jgi:hypothetical protein
MLITSLDQLTPRQKKCFTCAILKNWAMNRSQSCLIFPLKAFIN